MARLDPLHRAWRYLPFRWGAIIASLTAATLLLLPGLHFGSYSANQFLPHATCYLRDPAVIWLNVIGDSFIALAYLSISTTLGYIVYRARHDIPFHWMFAAFGLFIVACGFTHIMGVITVWRPYYWLAGDVKAITAVASVVTAVILPFTVPRVFSMIHDAKLSEERKHQLEVAYSRLRESDELKSQFFANISHELRTPLSLILGPIQRQLSSGELRAEGRQQLQVAERNAQALLHHVNNLLDLAKLDARSLGLDYARIDLAQTIRLVASYFEVHASERDMFFELDVPESLTADVDPDKVQRILMNLLSNAFKFTPEGGVVRCAAREEAGHVVVIVEDSGPGIPDAQRDIVFERFRQMEGGPTRRVGGTGLGLAIAKEFVELHGGRIDVTSARIGGARFEIRLPSRAPDAVEISDRPTADSLPTAVPVPLAMGFSAAEETEPDRSNTALPLVLVVEDNPEMSAFIASSLGDRYRVATARDGVQGLARARRLRPDAILTDIMMPLMSGDELVGALRADEELREIPIMVLTAKADEEQRIALLEGGADDHLTKPFRAEELLARVDGLVRRRQDTIAKLRELNTALEDRVAERTREVEQHAAQLRRMAAELSTVEQRERRRLASVLHDDIQQLLVTAKLGLDETASTRPDAYEPLERTRQMLEDAIRAMRHVTVDLYPPVLYDVGLAASLEWLGRRAGEIYGLPVTVTTHSTANPPDTDVQAFLFSAVKELLLNVVKHAGASGASVTMTRAGDDVLISVEDDGQGSDPETVLRGGGGEAFGLFSIRERLTLLGGTISVESPPGAGLRVTIACPMEADDE